MLIHTYICIHKNIIVTLNQHNIVHSGICGRDPDRSDRHLILQSLAGHMTPEFNMLSAALVPSTSYLLLVHPKSVYLLLQISKFRVLCLFH